MTSYQKLKEENIRLKQDINKILAGDAETITRYNFKKSLGDLSMYGDHSNLQDGDFSGLIPVIVKPHRISLLDKKVIN